MALHIETGHPVTRDTNKVEGNRVRIVSEDGRTMFEIVLGRDGRSVEVRAVEPTKHDGKIYDTCLRVCPDASNAVTIRTALYEGT
jgi:hypothetical protein